MNIPPSFYVLQNYNVDKVILILVPVMDYVISLYNLSQNLFSKFIRLVYRCEELEKTHK